MNWEELLKDYNAKLAEALKGKTAEEQRQILGAATDALPQEARQYSFNKGHSTAKTEAETEIQNLKNDKTRLEGDVAKKDQTITELQEKNPDLEKLRKENEAALTAKDTERTKQVEALTARVKKQAVDTFAAKVEHELSTRKTDPLNPRAAKYFVRDLIESGRIKSSDVTIKEDGTIEGGEVTLYQKDGLTPWNAPENTDTHVGYANTVHAEADPLDIVSTVGGGAGEALGGNGGQNGKAYFEQLRTETKQENPDDKSGALIGWDD